VCAAIRSRRLALDVEACRGDGGYSIKLVSANADSVLHRLIVPEPSRAARTGAFEPYCRLRIGVRSRTASDQAQYEMPKMIGFPDLSKLIFAGVWRIIGIHVLIRVVKAAGTSWRGHHPK
jgi:hypothetical protein